MLPLVTAKTLAAQLLLAIGEAVGRRASKCFTCGRIGFPVFDRGRAYEDKHAVDAVALVQPPCSRAAPKSSIHCLAVGTQLATCAVTTEGGTSYRLRLA